MELIEITLLRTEIIGKSTLLLFSMNESNSKKCLTESRRIKKAIENDEIMQL